MQRGPPADLHLSEIAQEHINTEVEKLIQKEAVKVVDAVADQFVSSIFAVPKTDAHRGQW